MTTDFAAPVAASLEVSTAAAVGIGPHHPVAPATRGPLIALAIVGVSVLALIVLVVVAYVLVNLGPVAFVIAAILALVPLTIVLLGVRWIDRWEPEPRLAFLFTFLWGAGFAVLGSLLVGPVVDRVLASAAGSSNAADFLGAVVEAPLVEEGGKGLGLLVIFLFARKHFDGPVDGVVYAASVAGGFAFVENILYFGSQVLDGGVGGLVEIFVIRGLMSPFAHVMFTACTGIALGIAARRAGTLGAIVAWLLGLIPAMLLHALWNGALYFTSSFYGYYLVVQLPLFVGALLLVLYLRRRESRMTARRLSEYAAVGWFSAGEVTSLATASGRRESMAWARSRGLGSIMKHYTRDATKLAFTRQRILTGRAAAGARADEQRLLASIVGERTVLQRALVTPSP